MSKKNGQIYRANEDDIKQIEYYIGRMMGQVQSGKHQLKWKDIPKEDIRYQFRQKIKTCYTKIQERLKQIETKMNSLKFDPEKLKINNFHQKVVGFVTQQIKELQESKTKSAEVLSLINLYNSKRKSQDIKEFIQNSNFLRDNQIIDKFQSQITAMPPKTTIHQTNKQQNNVLQQQLTNKIHQQYKQIQKLQSKIQQLMQKCQQLKQQQETLVEQAKAKDQIMRKEKQQRKHLQLKLKQQQQLLKQNQQMAFENIFNHKLEIIKQQKQIIINAIEQMQGKAILKSELLYQYSAQNTVNFHKYIDNHQRIIILIKTVNGRIFGGYSQQKLNKDIKNNKNGFIFCLSKSHNQIFLYNCKSQKSLVTIYDPYYIIFGNSELRLKVFQLKLFSNFGIINSYYDHRGLNLDSFLGEGSKCREIDIQYYEIYSIKMKNDNSI